MSKLGEIGEKSQKRSESNWVADKTQAKPRIPTGLEHTGVSHVTVRELLIFLKTFVLSCKSVICSDSRWTFFLYMSPKAAGIPS